MTGCFSHCPRVSSTSRSSPTSYARSRFTRPFITLLPTSLFLHQPTRIGDEKKHRRMGRKKSRKKSRKKIFRCKIFISLACPLHSPRVHRLGRNTSGGGAGSASGSNEFRPRTFSFPPPFAHRPRIHYRFPISTSSSFFYSPPAKPPPTLGHDVLSRHYRVISQRATKFLRTPRFTRSGEAPNSPLVAHSLRSSIEDGIAGRGMQ